MPFTADQVLSVLHSLLPIIAMFAAMPVFPQWTKDAVKVVEAIVDSEALRSLLRTLLGTPEIVNVTGDARTAAIHAAANSAATPSEKAALAAAGIDWQTFLQYLPQIIALILSAFGNRR